MEAAHTRISQLQQDLAHKESQLRNKLNANELQLKEQIVYNVGAAATISTHACVLDSFNQNDFTCAGLGEGTLHTPCLLACLVYIGKGCNAELMTDSLVLCTGPQPSGYE